ncbi:hypothetical protein LJB77_01110 [Ruminococcaceae bacterium OttesenSCG-928-N02]|nr:hypothetical protein [Ruminococcaceae bacterium OttesenSCG-928-N02]
MKYTRSKTALFLIELIIAVLFFSVASAVCIQLFAHSKELSERSAALNGAMLQLESCAEVYTATGGDMQAVCNLVGAQSTAEGFTACYTRTFSICEPDDHNAYYIFTAYETHNDNGLSTLELAVAPISGGEVLFNITQAVYAPAA